MRRIVVFWVSVLMVLAGVIAPSASAADYPDGQMVADQPAPGTPHVLNGRVYSIAQVGDMMILGGTFTRARNDNSGTELTRNRLLAFNVNTGQISTTFTPNPNGTVNVVLPAGDGESVYVGGSFGSIGGVSRDSLARVRVSDGAVLTQFNSGTISGTVEDLRLTGNRLWVAGAFTHIAGSAQAALATVSPTTGSFNPYMDMTVAGIHNGGFTKVFKIDVNPQGDRLVAVGNFDTLDGVQNHQLFMLDISGASVEQANFHTGFYLSTCSRNFDSYMRDLDFSPDGSFFAVTTSGAYGGSNSACDTTARFETYSTGTNIAPSWVDYTGGDTTYAVLITDSVVYTGGHARWQNNPFAGDREGPGAVSRPGIAALDPINGLPLSWNPTRTRGVGVFDFWLNERGLWVGSDTDRIGAYVYKGRIALMPLDGLVIPGVATPTLPNDVYIGDRLGLPGSDLNRRSFDGTAVGPAVAVDQGGINWTQIRGAFMINGWLYLAHSDGSFTRRTFDGSTYGSPVPVNTHDQLVTLQTWRSDIQDATAMFYDSGRIYFTQGSANTLYYRYFTPESDVVGAKRLVASGNVPGLNISGTRGMFTDGDHLYFARTDGSLNRIDWAEGPQSDRPVGGTATQVSGPGIDSALWNARALFLFQSEDGNPVPPSPTAAIAPDCTDLDCTFSGSGSTPSEPGASITDWDWDFGDGSTGSGEDVSHNYTAAGDYTVTLVVTDSLGRTDTTTEDVTVTAPNQDPVAAFTYDCTSLDCTFDAGGSSDPDGDPLTYAWDFGDGNTDTGETAQHSYAADDTYTVTLTVSDDRGGSDTDVQSVTVAFVNQPPTAAFTVSCVSLTCDFDAADSSDPDEPGQTLTYAWDFGDGNTDTGETAQHTYAGPGPQTVELTVSDGDLEDTAQQNINVTEAAGDVQFVAAATSAGNRSSHQVTVPAAVQDGDTLLMFLTTNSTNSTVDDAVPGWNLLESVDGNGMRGRLWSRTATGGDAGSTVTVSTSGFTKSVLAVAAYRADGVPSEVAGSGIVYDDGGGTSHDAPAIHVDAEGSWVVSHWAEKSTGGVSWTAPAGTTTRAEDAATSGGKISALLADSGGPVTAGGTHPAQTATTSSSVARTIGYSVVISPVGGPPPPPPPNTPPTAAFTVSCPSLTCSFDAGGSSDPDVPPQTLSYAWDFGDGNTGGDQQTINHTYASAGAYTVTLTVSDGTASDQTQQTANPTDAAAVVAFVGAASTSGNRTDHQVTLPGDVQAGDTLVLFLTTNSTNSTIDDAVPGWTLLESADGNGVRGRAWSRTAGAGDGGSQVSVSTSGWTKSVMAVAAYRGQGAASTITDSGIALANSVGTVHTTPTVDVASAGSWLISFWSEKGGGGTVWTLPGGVTERTESLGAGGGNVSGVLGDSAGPVPTGTAGGLDATTEADKARNVTYSVVVGLA